jgi:hypothetical protein
MKNSFWTESKSELQDVIEGREIQIRCWHCGWSEARTLSWLSSMRHMGCPTCSSVIVLDTSEVRREITRHRRQLATLHGQMVNILDVASQQHLPRPVRQTSCRANLDLALAHRHPDSSRRARGTRHRGE